MRTLSILWLIVFEPGLVCGTERVYSDLKDQRYWFQTVVVSREDFTTPQIEAMVRDFISGAGPGRDLVVFSIFTDIEDAAMVQSTNNESYRGWRADYDVTSVRALRAAEAIAVGDNVVLRVRHADGTVVRKVLAGKDPLRFEVDGAAFEILVVNPRTGTRFDRCDPIPSLSPVVKAKTSSLLTESLCTKATARVAELLKTRKLFIGFRNDHWFLGSYPVMYPFVGGELPPSEEEYYRTLTFSCSALCEEGPSCVQIQGPPLPPPGRWGQRSSATTPR